MLTTFESQTDAISNWSNVERARMLFVVTSSFLVAAGKYSR